MKNTSFYEICMFLYTEMGDIGTDERKNIDTLKQEVSRKLSKLEAVLHEKHTFDEADSIFSMAIDYAETYAKELFVHGVEQGVILCRAINDVKNTF